MVFVVSGCAPKVISVSKNPPKIYIKIPSNTQHPQAAQLAIKECKKLHPNYHIDMTRTYQGRGSNTAEFLLDSWLGLKPIVQSVSGVYGFHCRCLVENCKQE